MSRSFIQKLLMACAVGIFMPGCGVGVGSPKLANQFATAISSKEQQNAATIFFRDRTAESGVLFAYHNDESAGRFAILESMGGGVGLLDYDGDGRSDLFFSGGGKYSGDAVIGTPCGLFRNRGDWTFDDVTVGSGSGSSAHYSHGIAVADCDEDGFADALVTGYGGVSLYRNNGDGTFVERVLAAGLNDELWSISAGWGDFDGDGALDLYLVHYVDWSVQKNPICSNSNGQRDVCPPQQYEPLPDAVYFGNGDGTFRDGTREAGLRSDGKGIGVVIADMDIDGDIDIYVANDTVPNFLYRNDGHGHFEDVSLLSGTAVSDRGTPDASMGTDVGDFDLDGLPDLWVGNYERETFALYRNQGNCMFRHVSESTGIAALGANYVAWGTRFLDVDLDGDEDLMVSNGHAIRFPTEAPARQRPLLLENVDGRRFINVAAQSEGYLSESHAGRGLATGDLDGDGDEDVVFSNLNEPVAILSNETTSQGNWLATRIIGRDSCRSAVGSTAVATIGNRKLLRQIRGGSSYASSSDPTLHFGCGSAKVVDELTVRWPSGRTITLANVPCNLRLTIVEPRDSNPPFGESRR